MVVVRAFGLPGLIRKTVCILLTVGASSDCSGHKMLPHFESATKGTGEFVLGQLVVAPDITTNSCHQIHDSTIRSEQGSRQEKETKSRKRKLIRIRSKTVGLSAVEHSDRKRR